MHQTGDVSVVTFTVEPRFNEPLYNEVLGITNHFLQPGQHYSKMYGTEPRYNEPRYNEILVITNTIQKPKSKIFLDMTNNEAMTALRNFILSSDKTLKEKNFCARFLRLEDTLLRLAITKTDAILTEIFFCLMKRPD